MATGPSYRVPYRRRKEGKTDYQQRKALILSKLPRIVVRGSLRHISAQIVKAKTTGDEVIASANSGQLTKTYGWKGGCGNLSVAYLTGLLCGHRAVAHGVKKAVLDIGLQLPSRGARVFAVLKGVLDAGVVVPHEKEMLPDEKRVMGQHIVDYAKKLSSDQEAYQKKFSKYLARDLRPEQLPEHFSAVKEKIVGDFKGK